MNKKLQSDIPHIIKGGMSDDVRGRVSFVNEFRFSGIKRFYTVKNRKIGMVRAWHGHKDEAKYFFLLSGSVLVGAAKIDNWKSPSKDAKVYSFLLSHEEPAILYIPKGYANGFKSLTSDAKLMVFSTSTLEESRKDDFRFDAKYWNIWG